MGVNLSSLSKTRVGLYLRPGYTDHLDVQQLAAEGRLGSITGLVIDPCLIGRQAQLAADAALNGIETVLDPRALELSTEGGFALSGVKDLPWAAPVPHDPEELVGPAGLLLAEHLADFVVEHGLSAILSPGHLLEGPHDPWLQVDERLCQLLRQALDARGRKWTPIYYPLTVRSSVFGDAHQRKLIRAALDGMGANGVWLRIHPFGTSNSGPQTLPRYIEASLDLHELNIPLIAERTGTVGLALLAVGAVGGIESGITLGEGFTLDRLFKPPRGKGFLPAPRVYFGSLGLFLPREEAKSLLRYPGMKAAHGCQDSTCCRRGVEEMLRQPRRHFIIQRGKEVDRLGGAPRQLRARFYIDNMLRPAADRAARAAQLLPSIRAVSRRLDSWHGVLEKVIDSRTTVPQPVYPASRRSQ